LKILLIEGHRDTVEALSLSFQMGWPQAVLISTDHGVSGVEMAAEESPDMVMMGLSFPDIDGFQVLTEIRSFSNVPIVIVTDRSAEIDRVRGLELGADDYIVRPLGFMELLARIRALVRRRSSQVLALPERVDYGGVVIDFGSQQVELHHKVIKLTLTEYRILCELVRNPGRTISRETLLEKIWGEEYLDTPDLLKVHIHRLRRKLEDNREKPEMIITVSRRGYKFEPAAEPDVQEPGFPL
jgi:two-component system response regulator VicR